MLVSGAMMALLAFPLVAPDCKDGVGGAPDGVCPKKFFQLAGQDGLLKDNWHWEVAEQVGLGQVLRRDDTVLQLGGNIGTSCLFAAIHESNLKANLCVEPNEQNVNAIRSNMVLNNVTDLSLQVVSGIVGENCDGVTMEVGGDPEHNDWSHRAAPHKMAHAQALTSTDVAPAGHMQQVTCHPLPSLLAGKEIDVLFADCEGCLNKFVQTYRKHLSKVRAMVYEQDGGEMPDVDALAKDNGLTCTKLAERNLPVYTCI